MLNRFRKKSELENSCEIALKDLNNTSLPSDKFDSALERVIKLHAIKEIETSKNRISADTALNVAASLVGIWWMTRYERENVINSKALNFIPKLKS